MHFQNFLGVRGDTLCGSSNVPASGMTLDPARVTCQRCLELLGRLGDGNFGIPKKRTDDT